MGENRRRKLTFKKLARRNRRRVVPVYASRLSVVAVHEAGHVVGRFLTADIMGYDQAVAVSFIDMHDPFSQKPYEGPDGELYSQAAITYGPCFSQEINDAIEASGKQPATVSDSEAIYIARAAGANIDAWAKAKLFIILGGPVAEAIDRNISIAQIERIPECENDFVDARATCCTAGWSDEESAAAIAAAASAVYERFENSGVWGGLLKLAAALPVEGRIEGSEAWAIYSSALGEVES